MTSESNHHLSGPWALAASLAASAGFVDAFVFLQVTPVFVANMSGNLIHLGIATGEFHAAAAIGVLAALGGFAAGAMIGAAHLDQRVRGGRPLHSSTLLGAEALLLLLLPVLINLDSVGRATTVRAVDFPVIVIASLAMGVQAVALRRVGNVAVSTTHATGSVVRIAEKVVLGARKAQSVSAVRRRFSIGVLFAITVSYVLGAAVATPLGPQPMWLLIPAGVAGVGAVAAVRYRPVPRPDDFAAD